MRRPALFRRFDRLASTLRGWVSPHPVWLSPLLFTALFSVPGSLHAQNADEGEREPGWYDQAELSLVLTAGNASSNALGVSNRLERLFSRSSISLDVGGIRIETGSTRRSAIGTGPGDFEVREETDTETTAENYFATLRYDRELTDRSYAYGSAGWVRNRFSGIDDRAVGAVGLGWKLIENARTVFQADLAATLTSEDPVIGEAREFGGLRFTWNLGHQLTESAKFTSVLIADESLSETEDLRIGFDNALAVDISDVLAVKTGLKLLFDNLPASEEVNLFAVPGGPSIGTVFVPLKELDTQFTVALVVTAQ